MRQEAAVIYARVSTEQQACEGVSLDMQIARCAEYLEAHGLVLVDTVLDAGLSAKDIAHRAGFKRILDMARRKQIAHVITWKLDRAFRNTIEGLQTLTLLGSRCVELHIVSEQSTVKSETADDEFMTTLKLSLAARERKLVGERTKSALDRKRERGEFCGGEAPYGFQNVNGTLVEDLAEQKVIRRIVSLRKKGYSIRRIVSTLAEDGYLNRRGKLFQKTQVERILHREAA
jgi:site-specific DNA recombinase